MKSNQDIFNPNSSSGSTQEPRRTAKFMTDSIKNDIPSYAKSHSKPEPKNNPNMSFKPKINEESRRLAQRDKPVFTAEKNQLYDMGMYMKKQRD